SCMSPTTNWQSARPNGSPTHASVWPDPSKNMPAWLAPLTQVRSPTRAPPNGLYKPTRTLDMKLGFCGLGLMGAPMVQRLLEAGHEVKVWNRSADKAKPLAALGAQVVATAQEAAQDVDGVLMCLFNA